MSIFKSLRTEAERASQANLMLMAELKGEKLDRVSDKVSGRSLQDGVALLGAGVSAGSLLGLVGMAAANQAAALGTGGLIASASTALASLGTVAVGVGVLPVATVTALGAAVTGIAVVALSKMLPVNHEKGAAVVSAIRDGDRDQLSDFGRESPRAVDWLKGARALFFKSNSERLLGDQAPHAERAVRPDASLFYDMADLFSGSEQESLRNRQAFVEKLAGEIWEKTGAHVDFEALHSGLGKTRDEVTTVGRVVNVDKQRGLVVQSLGRGRATVHLLSDFANPPKVGSDISVSYKRGAMQFPQRAMNGPEAGVGR